MRLLVTIVRTIAHDHQKQSYFCRAREDLFILKGG